MFNPLMSIAPTLKKLLEISWFFNGASRLEEELEPSVYPILHDKWVKRDFSHFEAPDYGTTSAAWLPSKIYGKNLCLNYARRCNTAP